MGGAASRPPSADAGEDSEAAPQRRAPQAPPAARADDSPQDAQAPLPDRAPPSPSKKAAKQPQPALVMQAERRRDAEAARFRDKKVGFTGFRVEADPALEDGAARSALEMRADAPKSAADLAFAREALREVPLFTEEALEDVLQVMTEARCPAGGEMIAAGAASPHFVLLLDGEMRLRSADDDGGAAEAGPEQPRLRFANQQALLGAQPMERALVASTACRVWLVTRVQYQKATVDALKRKLERGGSLLENITEIPGLKELPRETREAIAAALRPVTFLRGDFLLRQGAEGDRMFFIEAGEVSIRQSSGRASASGASSFRSAQQPDQALGDGGVEVARRVRGDYIGEAALLDDGASAAGARNASAVADSDKVHCLQLERDDFREYMGSLRELFEHNQCLRVLKSLDLTKDLDDAQLDMIVSTLEEVEFEPGEYVVHQGEIGDIFYIVKDGTLECTLTEGGEQDDEQQQEQHEREPQEQEQELEQEERKSGEPGPAKRIGTLISGDYFGEGALLTNAPRRCNVFAVGPGATRVWGLRRSNFEKFLSEKVKAKLGATFQHRKSAKAGGAQRPVIAWDDLQRVRTLGSGSYGTVDLVRHRVTGETQALKRLRKATVVAKKQQRFVRKEKELMSVMQSPFLVNLLATFNKGDSVYMLLEVCLGGELYSLMKETVDAHCAAAEDEDAVCGCFEIGTQCRFFAACIVLAVEYMHGKGIIHRDIKPENLLLNEQGYLKLADFGFAKMVHDQRTYSLCGTPEYTAPEVYKRSGHSKGVDWWAMGVILYEMASGFSPFHVVSQNSWDCYIEIAKYEKFFPNIQFPAIFDETLCDLLLRLMHPNHARRYGTRKNGAAQLKEHPWFGVSRAHAAAVDWEAVEARTFVLDDKFRPRAPESGLDANNFESCDDRHEDDGKFVDESMMEQGGDWYNDF